MLIYLFYRILFLEVFVYNEGRELFKRVTNPWLTEGGDSTTNRVMWKRLKNFLKYLEGIFKKYLFFFLQDVWLNNNMKIVK